jgi:hypothetical protein
MKKIVRKKLDAFARRAKLKPEHVARLAAALAPASAAQADVILAHAARLFTSRIVATPASPILGPDGRPQEAAT